MDNDLMDQRDRFANEIAHIDVVVQVLLKGHLLLEEALSRLIDLYVYKGAYLEDARLTFKQKLNLAKALTQKLGASSGWDVLDAINVLRNDVSHRLDSPERKKRIARLRETYFRETPPSDLIEEIKRGPDSVLIVAACAYCAGFLAVYESGAKKLRPPDDGSAEPTRSPAST